MSQVKHEAALFCERYPYVKNLLSGSQICFSLPALRFCCVSNTCKVIIFDRFVQTLCCSCFNLSDLFYSVLVN